MAFSSSEGKLFFKDWLIQMFRKSQVDPHHVPVRRILDVGAGAGAYGKLIRECWDEANKISNIEYDVALEGSLQLEAVEIFEPYVERFKLKEIYDEIHINSVRNILYTGLYDLVIFGDVLEHMNKEEAIEVWDTLKRSSKFLYLSMPCKIPEKPWSVGYDQDPSEGDENKYELHQYDWTYNEILSLLGPFLWQVPLPTVVTMIAEGNLR